MIRYIKRFVKNILMQLYCIPEIHITKNTLKYFCKIISETWIYIFLFPILFVVIQNTLSQNWENSALKQLWLPYLFVIIPTIWGAIVSSSRMFRTIKKKIRINGQPENWNYCVCTSNLIDVTEWMKPEMLNYFANIAVVDECCRIPSNCDGKNLLRVFIIGKEEEEHLEELGSYKWWCLDTINLLHSACKMKIAVVSKSEFQRFCDNFPIDPNESKDFAVFFDSIPISTTIPKGVFIAQGSSSAPYIKPVIDDEPKKQYAEFASFLFNEIIDSRNGQVKTNYRLNLS